MHTLILNRLISNRTFTVGRLTASDDDKISIHTLEARIPLGKEKYIRYLLPPGTYPIICEKHNIQVGEEPFYGEWPAIKSVMNYPRAGFCNYDERVYPHSGSISVGNTFVDEFSLTNVEEAIIDLLRYCHGKEGEEMQLRIIENRDIIEFHDYTMALYKAMEQERLAEMRKEALRKKIYSS